MDDLPLMYTELAEWWPYISAPEDYAIEAEYFYQVFTEKSEKPIHTLLELGSGGGNNASYLKKHFQMTLVDRSPGMLAVSQKLNPECEHVLGDMRSVRLKKQFDAVFIHDAIMYMTNEHDLARALDTAAYHCRAGGLVILAPDETKEIYKPYTDHGGHDAPDGRGIRYLEWSYDANPQDSLYRMDFAYLVRQLDGTVLTFHDSHVLGLFSNQAWLTMLRAAGFEPQILPDPFDRLLFCGERVEDETPGYFD
jgi:hypothetical protein